MALTIMVNGPDNTAAELTKEQADLANPILVSMMNREMKVKEAESLITEKCAEMGIPLTFLPKVEEPKKARKSLK
jgi:transposase